MRLLKYNLLAVAAMLVVVSSASAYEFRLETAYDGSDVSASDLITVELYLDTQGQSNILLFEVGVQFDFTALSYERSLSTTGGNPNLYVPGAPNYILYGLVPSGRSSIPSYMEPRVPGPGGFTYDPPKEILPGQVNAGWVEINLGGTGATASNQLLATLVFHVLDGAQTSAVDLTLTDGGTVFQLGDTSIISDQVGLSGGFVVNVVPEPATALLIGLGIIGLGVAGRRR